MADLNLALLIFLVVFLTQLVAWVGKSVLQELAEDYVEKAKGNIIVVSEATRTVTRDEHKLGLFEAVSTYPKIVIWCMVLCLPIIGIHHDQTVMGAYYALPAFQHRYGRYVGGK